MTRYEPRPRPQFYLTPLVVVLGAVTSVLLIGALLGIIGALRGDEFDGLWVFFGVPAVVGPYGFATVRSALVPPRPSGRLPDGVAEAALVQVRSRFGLVFWLMTAATVPATWLVVATLMRMAEFTPDQRLDKFEATGLAAVGTAILLIGAATLPALALGTIPVRILRARNRVHLYLTADGIGWPPNDADDPGFLRWRQIHRIVHFPNEVSGGIAYTHVWRIFYQGARQPHIIRYPAGATPRPRSIAKRMRELASDIDVYLG